MRSIPLGQRKAAAIAVAFSIGLFLFCAAVASAHAKTPGSEYCFRGWCHRVSTIDEMDSMVGRRGYLTASYYDDCSRDRFNTCGLTSSGAVFHANHPDNAASPIFPDGTVILAYNPASKMAAVLRVTSAGPYHGDRKLDVSRGAAEQLGFFESGVAELIVTVLKSPNQQEARYKKLRVYEKVPGPIGRFDSFESAEQAAVRSLAMQANLTSGVANRSSATFENQAGVQHTENVVAPSIAQSQDAGSWTEAKLVTAADTVATALPLTEIEPMSAPKVIAVREGPMDDTVTAKLWRFVDAARDAARSRSGHMKTVAQSEEQGTDVGFLERLKRFVDAAQMHARRGSSSRRSVLANAAE